VRSSALAAAAALIVLVPVATGPRARGPSRALPRMPACQLHCCQGSALAIRAAASTPIKVPWRAVGKLQAATINFRVLCTGTLVGPSTVLTAANCVYNPRTNLLPGSLHFLIGYSGSLYAGHAVGVKATIGGWV
jgi:trypsin